MDTDDIIQGKKYRLTLKVSNALVSCPILNIPGAESPTAIPPRRLAILPSPAKNHHHLLHL